MARATGTAASRFVFSEDNLGNLRRLKYQLIIFDSDGTLADSLPWARGAFNQLADELGFRRLNPADHARLRDCSTREMFRELELPVWKLPRLVLRVRQLMALHAHELQPFPGIPEMLRQLAESGRQLAVVSSNSEENVRTILGPASSALVRHYSCGASLSGKAPHLRAVARAAGVKPSAALYLGDEARDGEAARRAGMDFAAVAWGQQSEERLRSVQPVTVFQAVDEIVPWVIRDGR